MKSKQATPTYYSVEEKLFAAALLATVPYFISGIILRIQLHYQQQLIAIYSGLLVLSVGMLFILWKRLFPLILIQVFSVLLLVSFAYFMPQTSGPAGGAPYVFQMMATLLILLNRGGTRQMVVAVLLAIIILYTSSGLTFSGTIAYKSLFIEYLLNLIFVTGLGLFFKHQFDGERHKLRTLNVQLEKLNNQLDAQSEQLLKNNLEIRNIQQNLESTIEQRTQKLQEENERMVEYAFINAHLVRAPIANIMGLTELDCDDDCYQENQQPY